MIEVTIEEINEQKILPYNVFSESGEKLLSAGETISPGKLLQLKHLEKLFRDDVTNPEVPQREAPESSADVVVEKFDMHPKQISRDKLSIDDVDVLGYRGLVNKNASIEPQTQVKIKAFFNQTMDMLKQKPASETVGMFVNIRDKIHQDIILEVENVIFCSELKLLGEYSKCHALNTAILSGIVANKMGFDDSAVLDIILAGLLHDIGKTCIQDDENKNAQKHTLLGYKLLKEEMNLPENIAKVALEHHENNDGSGFPQGLSGDWISKESQIINVCNYFDNITFNKTQHKVKNTKEALRVLLEFGSKRFSPEVLYTFVHMFSYNDIVNFEDMVD